MNPGRFVATSTQSPPSPLLYVLVRQRGWVAARKVVHAVGVKVRVGPTPASFVSRTGTVAGRFVAASRQLPPSPLL
jgi:hypothetical protein